MTVLKLDRQFINGVDDGGADFEIVRGVIRLAHALGLRTVAEGVETVAQFEALRWLGCDSWQGYLHAPALPEDLFVQQLDVVVDPKGSAATEEDRTDDIVDELDSFVLRRISDGRWAHLGGRNRGEGWAGIVEIDEAETPVLIRTRGGDIQRFEEPGRGWMFGPYHPASAIMIPLDNDTVVVFGSPNDGGVPERDDADWLADAEQLADRVRSVSPAKRLADELEMSEALHNLIADPPSTLDESMRRVVDSITSSLSCEFGVIYLRDQRRVVFSDGSIHAVDHDEFLDALDSLADGLTSPRCEQNSTTTPLPLPLPPDFSARSWLALPTAHDLGGMVVCAHTDRNPRGFTTLCQQLGSRLADAAELVLRSAAERERLNSQADSASVAARTDALTGTTNRLGWTEAVNRAVQDGTDLAAVIVVDVNDLKVVNDTHGHAAGDEVLTTVGRVLTSVVRKSDTVARIGGDEFAVLLPGADRSSAERVERAIHAAIARERESCPTLSIAVGAAVGHPGVGLDDVMEEADRTMYAAKAELKGEQAATTADGRRLLGPWEVLGT